jgi:acetyltransferase
VGGVALNVASDDEVREFIDRCSHSVHWHSTEAEILGFGVQPMVTAPDGVELILGSRKDAVFGPVIMIGLGGVAAEVLEDFSLGLPPLNERLARRMLEALRSWPILAGQRHRPAVCIERLLETLIRFSYLVADSPRIAEIDVNPLLVSPREVIALDARVRVDPSYPVGMRPFSHLAIHPYPEHLVRQSNLLDGTPVTLRPIRPEDEPLWHEMLAECSTESIRYRFRSMFREMSHERATRFCFMDYDRELAMIAESVVDGQRRMIGAAHLYCDVDHTKAEFAVLVPDRWQRQGVGYLTTQACLEIAANWGLREVFGETDPHNYGMRATFEKAGFELHYQFGDDVIQAKKIIAANSEDKSVLPT